MSNNLLFCDRCGETFRTTISLDWHRAQASCPPRQKSIKVNQPGSCLLTDAQNQDNLKSVTALPAKVDEGMAATSAAALWVSTDLDPTLAERHASYGSFIENSNYASQFLEILDSAQKYRREKGRPLLLSYQKNAMVMICQKMSRLLSGEASHPDTWHAIEGYARLGAKPD